MLLCFDVYWWFSGLVSRWHGVGWVCRFVVALDYGFVGLIVLVYLLFNVVCYRFADGLL